MNAKTKPLILLVDDCHSIRRICRMLLEGAGCQIVEADSPRSAEALWEANASGIALLITDFEMPGATGLQLAAKLRLGKPELKVLLISGNCQEAIPHSISFLQKPFSPRDFVGTVRTMLS